MVMPKNIGTINVADMLSLPSMRSERQEKRLSANAMQLLQSTASIVDEMLCVMIGKRTAVEFVAARDEMFPKYFHAVRAVSDLARIIVPDQVLEIIAAESFSEAEAEFRDQGLAAFGTSVRDQAIFTVWSLRKISDLCKQIDRAKPADDLKESDSEMFHQFAWHAIGTRFHLDCLMKSMQLQKPMFPEVLDVVIDGLRNIVNAYAWARLALDLRYPVAEVTLAPIVWDEEEQALLNEATFDLLGEPA